MLVFNAISPFAFFLRVYGIEEVADQPGDTQGIVHNIVADMLDKLFDRAFVTFQKPYNFAVPISHPSSPSAFLAGTSPSFRFPPRFPREQRIYIHKKIFAATSNKDTFFPSPEMNGKSTIKAPFEPAVVGSYSYPGLDGPKRKINQDRGCIVYPFAGNLEQALFGVFDGHGARGERVADLALEVVLDTLENDPNLVGDEMVAFEAAFTIADEKVASQKVVDPQNSGSTGLVALVRGNQIWVANAGDCRIVLVSKIINSTKPSENAMIGIQAKQLAERHNPDVPTERKRIEQSGGFVSPRPAPDLPARVWADARMTKIGLATSRSIGDLAAKSVGVIASPEVSKYEFERNDLFMILASDGIWEFIPAQEAGELVWGVLQSGGGATEATQLLIETASRRWLESEGDYRDDITAIVISLPFFDHATTPR